MFVAVSIGTSVLTPDPESRRNTSTYLSPVVFHYANLLFLSLIALIPTQTWESFALVIGAAGAGSVIYSIVIAVRVHRNSISDLADRLCYGAIPALCYAIGPGRGALSARREARRPQPIGRRGAAAARHQYPQRLGSDDFAGATGQSAAVTLIFVPAFTLASVFTSPSAFAQMLQGLASRVSSPWEIGVRPKPSAMAWPSGQ